MLSRAVDLLRQMEEFSRSRYKLEARYHHVLVDEFQDTSRAQWELVSLLVKSWGEGFGAAADALPPSIFVVGDRKQSIYGFRDAESAVLGDAADFIETLRPDGQPRHAISVSFRAAPALLAFVNELFAEIAKTSDDQRRDAFRYDERDRFPIDEGQDGRDGQDGRTGRRGRRRPIGFIAADTVEATAELVADEIVRLLAAQTVVRDRDTGVAARGDGRRHRDPLPIARQPSRVRGGARSPRRVDVRLQGTRILRRRRDPGRDGAAAVSGGSDVGHARGGVHAIADRAAVGSRRRGARPDARARR